MNLAAEQQFPAKWPFPPAPPARRIWGPSLPWFRRQRRKGWVPEASPASVLSSSPTNAMDAAAGQASIPRAAPSRPIASLSSMSSAASSATASAPGQVTLRQMVVDVLLVAMWGAMIPGLMWLGAAAGF